MRDIKADKNDESEKSKKDRERKYDITELLKNGLIAFLFIMLIVGVWGIYSSLNQIISIWFSYKYAAIYKTILNVGLVVVVLYFLTRLIEGYKRR